MTERFVFPFQRALDNSGASISGALLNFYLTGTTTRKNTFSDRSLTTANANPVVADSAGRFSDIFLLPINYKVVLTDASGTQIWSADPVYFGSEDIGGKATFQDDFIGTIKSAISSTKGSGANTEAAVISAGDGGRVTLKSSTANGAHSANASVITLDTLDWSADAGGLVMEARLAIDDVSEAMLFVGFTDVISSTVELPINKASGTDNIDSDAANACGVCYDVDGVTDEFFHGGVKADTDTAAQHSGSAPTDGTFFKVRVEVSAAGVVEGFIDDVSIGTAVSAAITITTPLTPAIVIANRSANQVIATIDYIWVQQDRG
jgi:hypothetical protein